MSFYLEQPAADTLKIIFSGKLDVDNVAKIWRPATTTVIERQPEFLILDFQKVDYCDGAGIALIEVLQRQQLKHGGGCVLDKLDPKFQKFLKYVEQHGKVEREEAGAKSFPEKLGYVAVDILKICKYSKS